MLGNHPKKDTIISAIEDETRGGEAFDDKVMEVLHKLSCADLFRLQAAFNQSYRRGRADGRDDG
jgi:hypothetical protein